MNLINWLNGRKTTIGAIIFFVLYGALGVGMIDETTFNQGAYLAELITGIGLVHKVVKQVS